MKTASNQIDHINEIMNSQDDTGISISHLLLVWIIYDRKALFAKGSRKSEEFKHFNGFFSYFLELTISKICFD